ncbi:MAG: hypothetical protein ABIG95_02600 [Candidatus Woesearchaeota archaeon]
MESYKDLIKSLRKIRTKREKFKAQVSELQKQEDYLEGIIINQMLSDGVQRVTVKHYGICFLKHEIYPSLMGWNKFINYVMKYKEYTLLTKKVNSKAWRELLEAGQKVPGVDSFEKDTLQFRRK